MVEQSIDTISKAFKLRVNSPTVFLEARVDCLLVFVKASVNIRTILLESRVDSLPVLLKTSVNIRTIFPESRVNQLMGAVKSGVDGPKGGIFAILSLPEERVDVGCQIHELLVDIGPKRIDIRSKRSYIRLRCRGGVYGGRVRHWFLRGRGLRCAGSGDEDQFIGDRPRLPDCTYEPPRASAQVASTPTTADGCGCPTRAQLRVRSGRRAR